MSGSYPYGFALDVMMWICETAKEDWLQETKAFGDRSLETDDCLLLQRSRNEHGDGITIQAVGIRQQFRRKGYTRALLNLIHDTAEIEILNYILVRSVVSEGMEQLVVGNGYKLVPNGGRDFIKCIPQ